jgi:hypothetical protein
MTALATGDVCMASVANLPPPASSSGSVIMSVDLADLVNDTPGQDTPAVSFGAPQIMYGYQPLGCTSTTITPGPCDPYPTPFPELFLPQAVLGLSAPGDMNADLWAMMNFSILPPTDSSNSYADMTYDIFITASGETYPGTSGNLSTSDLELMIWVYDYNAYPAGSVLVQPPNPTGYSTLPFFFNGQFQSDSWRYNIAPSGSIGLNQTVVTYVVPTSAVPTASTSPEAQYLGVPLSAIMRDMVNVLVTYCGTGTPNNCPWWTDQGEALASYLGAFYVNDINFGSEFGCESPATNCPGSPNTTTGNFSIDYSYAIDDFCFRRMMPGSVGDWSKLVCAPGLEGLGPSASPLTSPTPGSRFASTAVSFQWNQVSGATNYWIDVGTPASCNLYYTTAYYGAMPASQTSLTVNLPVQDGSQVCVNFYAYVNGSWQLWNYFYLAPVATPQIYSPTPGSVIQGGRATFTWTAIPAIAATWLDVSTTPGGTDIYTSPLPMPYGTTSQPVTKIPMDASTVYVRLWYTIDGPRFYNDYTYQGGWGGLINSPTPGSALSSTDLLLQWTAAQNATDYWLDVGSSPTDAGKYFIGDLQSANTEATITGLPDDGSPVYAVLWAFMNGAWVNTDSANYTAVTYTKAQMCTPTPGATLSGDTVTFDWSCSPGNGPTDYYLWVGTTQGGYDLYSSEVPGTSVQVSDLPGADTSLFVRLFSALDGAWVYNDYTYIGANVFPAVVVSPAGGSTLSGSTLALTWTNGGNDNYWVDVGSTPSAQDIYTSANYGGPLSGTTTSLTIPWVPTDGSTIYVTLYSYFAGAWTAKGVSYTTGP